jgi:hypothetical protein
MPPSRAQDRARECFKRAHKTLRARPLQTRTSQIARERIERAQGLARDGFKRAQDSARARVLVSS